MTISNPFISSEAADSTHALGSFVTFDSPIYFDEFAV